MVIALLRCAPPPGIFGIGVSHTTSSRLYGRLCCVYGDHTMWGQSPLPAPAGSLFQLLGSCWCIGSLGHFKPPLRAALLLVASMHRKQKSYAVGHWLACQSRPSFADDCGRREALPRAHRSFRASALCRGFVVASFTGLTSCCSRRSPRGFKTSCLRQQTPKGAPDRLPSRALMTRREPSMPPLQAALLCLW